jgi:hypothetical protein
MHNYFPLLVHPQLMLHAFCKIPSSTPIQQTHKIFIFTRIFISPHPFSSSKKEDRILLKELNQANGVCRLTSFSVSLKVLCTAMSQLRITKSDIRLILHGTRQLLVYVSDVHTPGGNVNITNNHRSFSSR